MRGTCLLVDLLLLLLIQHLIHCLLNRLCAGRLTLEAILSRLSSDARSFHGFERLRLIVQS